jgi:hypothetical protein
MSERVVKACLILSALSSRLPSSLILNPNLIRRDPTVTPLPHLSISPSFNEGAGRKKNLITDIYKYS